MFRLLQKFRTKQLPNSYFEVAIKKYIDPSITQNLCIIDVGANRGHFYDEFVNIFPNCEINSILIEPIPECYELLQRKYESYVNVKLINSAISDKIGKTTFFINEYDETSSLLQIKKDIPELSNVKTNLKTAIEINTLTIDEILNNYDQIVDVLKIDVQGTEHEVLDGASKSIKKIKYIWIEVSFKALYDGSSTFNDIYERLTTLDFNLFEITDGHRSPSNELLQANCLFKNSVL